MIKGYTVERYVNKADWLSTHETSIGGSSAGTILGVNKWQTKLDLFYALTLHKKLGRKGGNKANIEIGNKSEDLIRQTFAVLFPNLEVIAPNGWETYKSIKYPFMIATLDGRLVEKTGKKRQGFIEIKTCDIRSKQDYDEWFEFDPHLKKNVVKHLKPQYFAQVIHYFNVMNDHKFAYVVIQFRFFDWDSPLENKTEHLETHFVYIERSEIEDSCKNLAKLECQFMEDVKNKRIPKTIVKLNK